MAAQLSAFLSATTYVFLSYIVLTANLASILLRHRQLLPTILAPKAIASELREAFLKGTGLGAVYSGEGAINNKNELRSNILGLQ